MKSAIKLGHRPFPRAKWPLTLLLWIVAVQACSAIYLMNSRDDLSVPLTLESQKLDTPLTPAP